MLCGVDYNYCLSIGKDMKYPRNLQGFRGLFLWLLNKGWGLFLLFFYHGRGCTAISFEINTKSLFSKGEEKN